MRAGTWFAVDPGVRAQIAVLVVLFLLPRAARAEGWYGWQTIGSDLVAVGLVADGAVDDSDAEVIAGLTLHVVGPALIHLAYGERERAARSVGVRLVAPTLALLSHLAPSDSGTEPGCAGDPFHCAAGAGAIALVVIAAIVVIDARSARTHDDASLTFRAADMLPEPVMVEIGGRF